MKISQTLELHDKMITQSNESNRGAELKVSQLLSL